MVSQKTKTIPLKLSDGTTIKAEVTPIGEQPVSSETRVFKKATSVIKSLAEDIAETYQEINKTVKPDKLSVTLGLEIGVESGQLTTLIVKGTGKANLEITMEWGE
ncbi:MAG: CU044_2847 family protein [Microcystaceae cyanobacterium]